MEETIGTEHLERLRGSKCARAGAEGSSGPPHWRGSPPFSGANAGSTLRPHPGVMKRNVVVVKTLPA